MAKQAVGGIAFLCQWFLSPPVVDLVALAAAFRRWHRMED